MVFSPVICCKDKQENFENQKSFHIFSKNFVFQKIITNFASACGVCFFDANSRFTSLLQYKIEIGRKRNRGKMRNFARNE